MSLSYLKRKNIRYAIQSELISILTCLKECRLGTFTDDEKRVIKKILKSAQRDFNIIILNPENRKYSIRDTERLVEYYKKFQNEVIDNRRKAIKVYGHWNLTEKERNEFLKTLKLEL